MARFFVMDPNLLSLGGHYYSYDQRVIEEVQKRGVECVLYAQQGVNVPPLANVVPQPLFTYDNIFTEAVTDEKIWAIENFHTLNNVFANDLFRIPSGEFVSGDVVYFPNLLQNQLFGVALWLAHLPIERRPIVVIMLRWLNQAMDYIASRPGVEFIPLYYRYAARTLLATNPRTILCADTRELAAAYTQIIGFPVTELPNPMDVRDFASDLPRDPKARPVVLYQGHTSFLRGFHLIPEMIQATQPLAERPIFVIQVQDPKDGFRAFVESIEQLPAEDVEIVLGALENDAYLALLDRADIVLLPYSPKFYGHGSSGVFTEAASMGKVTVVTAGTVPAREAAENHFGVEISEEWTGSAMASALLRALANLDELRERSRSAAPAYRARHSARGFVDELTMAVSRLQ